MLRRVWTKRGRRPTALSHPRYEWLYLYGFVHPASGAVHWFSGSTVDTDRFAESLAGFARAAGAGSKKLILLVLDGAGWHGSPDLAVPEGIRLVFLPSYSPELQPAEHLWPLTNEAIANQHFDSKKRSPRAAAFSPLNPARSRRTPFSSGGRKLHK